MSAYRNLARRVRRGIDRRWNPTLVLYAQRCSPERRMTLSDFEPPDVYSETTLVARKAHGCCECPTEIPPGARYVRIKGLWDGRWETFAMCLDCERVRKSAEACRCARSYPIGGMIEEITGVLAENVRAL